MYILINVSFCSESDTENIKNDQEQDYQTIMNILLQNPEELDLKHKPSAIRDDNMFTLDRRTVSIESAKADDNGAYISKGKAKKTYWYSEDGAGTAHKNENGVWYVNERWHKGYKHKYVPEHEVYEMSRQYHSSKHNPTFTRTIITIRCVTKQEMNPFYMVIYKWSSAKKGPFIVPRHGNACKPQASQYYRKDPSLCHEVDKQLASGLSTDQVYNNLSKARAETVSETISSPKFVDNRKFALKTEHNNVERKDTRSSETEQLISSLHTNPLVSSVVFTKEEYVSVNCTQYMLEDLHRFCVIGNSELQVDTTFELVDNLWLTDTSFSNEALLNINNEHPQFPGPSFFHFHKKRECYRRFAGELVIQKPELSGIKKAGTDLDKALSNGITDIFKDAEKLWCTHHMQERDLQKLKTLGCNPKTQSKILADIYGCQNEVLWQDGLADADDEDDYDAKLERFKAVWDDLVPGFHAWFDKNRSKLFKDCLIVSARQALGIEGRFTTNGLELKHKLQKKKMREEDIPKEVSAVTKVLNAWVNEYHIEEERALRGLGKFRLAPGYERFLVDPVRWNRWGPERQKQHVKAFRAFTPLSSDKYKKPTSAGLKCTPTHKRRRTVLPEPQLFTNRAEPSTSQLSSDQAEPPSKKVTPLRLQKQTGQSLWQVDCYILNLHSEVLLFHYRNLHFIYFTYTGYTIGCEHRVEAGFNNLYTIIFFFSHSILLNHCTPFEAN